MDNLKALEQLSASLGTVMKQVENTMKRLPAEVHTKMPEMMNDFNAIKKGMKSGDTSKINEILQRNAGSDIR